MVQGCIIREVFMKSVDPLETLYKFVDSKHYSVTSKGQDRVDMK